MKKWIREHKKLFILIIVVLVIVVLIIIGKVKAAKNVEKVVEETTTVESRELQERVSSTGTFESSEAYSLSAESSNGRIISINCNLGDYVTKGTVLATVDAGDLNDDLDDAMKDLAKAQKNQEKTIRRTARNSVKSQEQYSEDIKGVDEKIVNAGKELNSALDEYNTNKEALDGMSNTDPGYAAAQQKVTTSASNVSTKYQTYVNLAKDRDDDIQDINDNFEDTVDNYADNLESAQDNVDNAQEQVDDLVEKINSCTLKAPANGTVTAINFKKGQDYSGGTILSIQNAADLEISTEIDEYDINSIKVGQKAVIKTNATGDDELTATVVSVSPAAVGYEDGNSGNSGSSMSSDFSSFDISSFIGSSGSYSGTSSKNNNEVTFAVRLSLDNPCDRVRIGMSAKINIITESSDNVLSVPFDALQTNDKGEYFVQVVTGKDDDGNYKTKDVVVETGIESDYYVEIKGTGIKEGVEILIPNAEKGNSIEELLGISASEGV